MSIKLDEFLNAVPGIHRIRASGIGARWYEVRYRVEPPLEALPGQPKILGTLILEGDDNQKTPLVVSIDEYHRLIDPAGQQISRFEGETVYIEARDAL